MTQNTQLNKETAKALVGYYSWHMDELLKLYNAMGQTHETDSVDGFHKYFIQL